MIPWQNVLFVAEYKKNQPIMYAHCAISMEMLLKGAVAMCNRPVSGKQTKWRQLHDSGFEIDFYRLYAANIVTIRVVVE